MEPPIADLARLNVNDARENNALTDIVQTSTMNAEPADWKIMAWQACQQGRSVDVKSILRNLEPQDVSHFVNARGEDDNTALIIVAAVAHKDVACATIIPVLLEAGADINAKNKKGRTALMEAALWGGLAAVKALLKWKRGVPVNASLEDNFGLSAIELAGTDSKLATERKNRCAHGKNVQTLLDGKLRIRIVKLLKPVDNGKNVPRSTRHVSMQKRIEDGKDRIDADILKETQAKLKAAEDLAKRHLADLEKTRRELRKKEGELVREHSKLMNAQTDMNDVYAKFRPPSRSNVDRAEALAIMSTQAVIPCDAALEELKRPWSATTLTETQQQRRSDVASAKILWSQVLVEFRQKQGMTVKNYNLRRKRQPFFQFLDLPGELRNMIYDICLDNEKTTRNPDMTKRTRVYRGSMGSKSFLDHNIRQKRVKDIRARKPTREHRKQDAARKVALEKIVERKLKHAIRSRDGLTVGAHEAFYLYKLEHNMYTLPSKRVTDGQNNHDQGIFNSGNRTTKKGVLEIDVRGNLVDDLPMLSYVDRAIFSETLFLYYSTVREGLWIKWTVRNLDFFPFLRFYQAFTRGDNAVEIPPSRLHIEFDKEKEETDDGLHAKKFVHVKRLVELHWLDGFPLWGCLTGLSDRQDCKGPFGDYMYSVRQVVALYRIDHEAWKSLSVEYLRRCEAMGDDDALESDFATLSDAELVEAVIDMLCGAIEYNLGYTGSYARIGRDQTEWDQDVFETFRYKGSHVRTAYEKEHAIVRVVSLYQKKVDRTLRDRLGEVYEDWESVPDDALIPEGVVL
ncbi:uncharacterized protein J4E92_000164 [Alternaria infectoria]|uniref:uncharacterized protein n=1 Tax=Alternaria infectoria TaxID=45303 RepID=UPI00221FF6F8|nr:uncharacterized protein J4E92_000164 [Alternaria infectoria]KAI4938883.1 hypothetical protein J4E92_000164 [Alternaria infectoria]